MTDGLEPPTRDLNAPLRFPVANVFRTPSSAVAISGRVCSGLVQVGERLRVVPGDESALVKGTSLSVTIPTSLLNIAS